MKKILIAFPIVLLGVLITPAFAGTISKINHNIATVTKKKIKKHELKQKNDDWAFYLTRQQFMFDFPNATDVHWHQGYFAEATFNEGGSIKTAYYDDDNNLVGTTNSANYSDLPENARKTITKWYPDYTVNQVILFKDNEDNDTNMFLYSTSFDDRDNYFVELSNGAKMYVVKVDTDGRVSFFQQLY